MYKLRAVPINVNYRYVDDELAYLFADADLAGLVYGAEFPARVTAVARRVRRCVIVEATPGAVAAAATRRTLADGTVDYDDIVAAAPPRGFDTRSADDHYVIYTGGTTGRPKGVVWRQEDIIFTALGGGNVGGPPMEHPEDVARTVVENRAQRVGPFLPPGHPGSSSSSGSGSVRSCTRVGSGRRSARCSAAARACSTPTRHLDLRGVLDSWNARASSR